MRIALHFHISTLNILTYFQAMYAFIYIYSSLSLRIWTWCQIGARTEIFLYCVIDPFRMTVRNFDAVYIRYMEVMKRCLLFLYKWEETSWYVNTLGNLWVLVPMIREVTEQTPDSFEARKEVVLCDSWTVSKSHVSYNKLRQGNDTNAKCQVHMRRLRKTSYLKQKLFFGNSLATKAMRFVLLQLLLDFYKNSKQL